MTIIEALRSTTESIKRWAENRFLNKENISADDFGIYVQDNEPTDALDGDIWVDTSSESGAGVTSTVADYVSKHNTSMSAHDDIRRAIADMSNATPTKTSDLENDSGFITGYTETDPTVPNWAKAASKPSYTKSEIGLGNVANVLQYSASNPPPYPVSSVNGNTGAVSVRELPAVTSSDNGKVLIVVNGAWTVANIGLSVDSNGVVSL